MQTLIFGGRRHGVSKAGKDYDFSEVSDGFASFLLENGKGVGEVIEEQYKKGDEVEVEVHVSVQFGALRGTIVAVK